MLSTLSRRRIATNVCALLHRATCWCAWRTIRGFCSTFRWKYRRRTNRYSIETLAQSLSRAYPTVLPCLTNPSGFVRGIPVSNAPAMRLFAQRSIRQIFSGVPLGQSNPAMSPIRGAGSRPSSRGLGRRRVPKRNPIPYRPCSAKPIGLAGCRLWS